MKGGSGKYLQGIGLMFTNGFISPISENQAYSNAVTPALAYRLDLEE